MLINNRSLIFQNVKEIVYMKKLWQNVPTVYTKIKIDLNEFAD